MEFRIERKVSFIETASIEADSFEDLKGKLKTATLDWDVDFESNPEVEAITAYEEDGDECFDLEPNIMEEDYVGGMNGCIISTKRNSIDIQGLMTKLY